MADDDLSSGSILLDLLSAPVLGPIRGLVWIAKKLQEQAESELLDEDKVRGGLLELQMRLEIDEITEEEYAEQESVLVGRLNAIREAKAERARQ